MKGRAIFGHCPARYIHFKDILEHLGNFFIAMGFLGIFLFNDLLDGHFDAFRANLGSVIEIKGTVKKIFKFENTMRCGQILAGRDPAHG